jgi:histidyl-tRNA synthetase
MEKVQTLKGFRDIAPEEALKRGRVLSLVKSVLKSYGFLPMETPTLEYAELVEKEVGEEMGKLIYKFEDRGGRMVALRAEETPSLARFIAQNYAELTLPFKRYQIGSIFRAEKPQKGRFREFTQIDYDTVGIDSPLADAEIITVTASIFEALGITGFTIKVNDRALFKGIPKKALATIDKLEKIGEEKVREELKEKGLSVDILTKLTKVSPTPRIKTIFRYLKDFGISEENYRFEPTLARGLDYYTGVIFEVFAKGEKSSLAGGGRYDKLIGKLSGKDIPAVGIALGLDRLLKEVPQETLADVPFRPQFLVTVFSEKLTEESIKALTMIQSQGVDAEIYLDPKARLQKQLKYADKRGIPYVVIIGDEEAQKGELVLKNLTKKTQQAITLEGLLELIATSATI